MAAGEGKLPGSGAPWPAESEDDKMYGAGEVGVRRCEEVGTQRHRYGCG